MKTGEDETNHLRLIGLYVYQIVVDYFFCAVAYIIHRPSNSTTGRED